VTTASDDLRKQTDQTAQALKEQTKGMRELTSASENAARQLKLIAAANKEHSSDAEEVHRQFEEIASLDIPHTGYSTRTTGKSAKTAVSKKTENIDDRPGNRKSADSGKSISAKSGRAKPK